MTETGDYRELTPADLAHRWRERTLLEYVDEAIPAEPQDEYADHESALRWLLRLSWSDLQDARRRAANGVWSMECDYAVNRIVGVTALVGPAHWGTVPVDLILDGVYERIHELAGAPTPLSDEDRQRARDVLDRRRG